MRSQRRRDERLANRNKQSQAWTSLPWRRSLIGVVALYLALQLYPLFINSDLGRLATQGTAAMLWLVLWITGRGPSLEGSTLVSNTTEFVVIPECTIFAPLALFTAGVLAFPSLLKDKIRGILIASLCLSLLNLVRLVSLYVLAITSPDIFDEVHLLVWQPLMAMAALVLWGIWASRRRLYNRAR